MTFEILEAKLKHCLNTSKKLLNYRKFPVNLILWLIFEIGNNVNEVRKCHVIY